MPLDSVGFGREAVAVVPHKGDFVGKTYLVVDMPEVRGRDVRWVDDVALALIEDVTLTVGGTVVETQTGEFMHLWNQLSTGPAHKAAFAAMAAMPGAEAGRIAPETLYVPLGLHYCADVSRALPLIAMEKSEVKLAVRFKKSSDLLHGQPDAVGELSARLAIDYVFADTDERRQVAGVRCPLTRAVIDRRETLITQVQHCAAAGVSGDEVRLDLGSLNHYCKELVFVLQPLANVAAKRHFDFSLGGRNPVRSALLKLNGHDRFERAPGKYFNAVQPAQHHTSAPGPGVNVYSFCLHPERYQPSGACHMSRIDSASLLVELEDPAQEYRASVYAVSYNVLRVMDGHAALAYSA